MSFMQMLFGGAPTPAPVAAVPTNVNNPGQPLPGTGATSVTAPNGVVPAGAAGVQGDGQPGNSTASPLANFADIWKTTTNAEKDTVAEMFAGLDPAKVMESARKVDFTKSLPAELQAKIRAGGDEGLEAMMAAMNSVAQTGYAQSAIATTKIVEQALAKQAENFQRDLPNQVKRLTSGEQMLANNPLLSNPAIQPFAEAVKEQLIRKNPNATSGEINTQVQDFFTEMGKAFGPKPAETAAQKSAKGEDWSAFLGS